jgi:hypothetical protein
VNDRVVQDLLIRALADAPYRDSAEWQDRGLADPERVERFARFLARHFYHERIVHFFKYSRTLARVTGRRPEAVLARPGFDAVLPGAVLGTRATAQAVADLVTEHVRDGAAQAAVPYLDDLLRYETAMMVVEAGPRVWSDNGRTEAGSGKSGATPEIVEGTILLDLAYDLPSVLPALLRPWSAVPQAASRPTRLLVARSPHGRVAVARGDDTIAAVVQLANGKRTLEQLAAGAGLAVARVEETLKGLVDLGAVRFSTGS